jgi:WD40 repeat protein
MERPIWVVTLGIFLISTLGAAVAAEPPAIFEMGIAGLRAAQIAPDEQRVAALAFQITKPGTVPVEIQIWDFRRRTLVRTRRFEVSIPSMVLNTSHVRYSTDGLLLAVYAGGGTVHVFRSSDLQELNQIQLELGSAQLSGFEVSPSSHILAVRRSFDRGGDVRIYDLDSGKELRGWPISKGFLCPLHRVLGVAWRGDGGLLAVTAPDNGPCTRFAGTIYVFDPNSAEPVNRFRVGFLPGSLAFGSNDKLYVASMMCGGYFAHRTTDLPILDAKTGRQVGNIPARKVGIRRTIAVSGNKRILLAYADREKTTFEGLEDTLKISDAQWQIVDLTAGQVLLTTPATEYDQSSLSTSGRFLLNLSTSKLRIFSVSGD